MRAAPTDLESLSAQEVLAHVVDEYHPRLYVACSFQKEASVILDILLAIEPAARVFTLDTGVLFPETYETWRRDIPTARSMPSSRVRSCTDSASVFTMPSNATMTDSESSA